jgi:hypothetical protein
MFRSDLSVRPIREQHPDADGEQRGEARGPDPVAGSGNRSTPSWSLRLARDYPAGLASGLPLSGGYTGAFESRALTREQSPRLIDEDDDCGQRE